MKVVSVLQPDKAQAGAGRLTLRPGQQLAAIVLKGAKPGGKALLSVAGGQLQVTTRDGLQKGEALNLVVRKTGRQLILSRQNNDPQQAAIQRLTKAMGQLLGKTELPAAAGRTSASTASAHDPMLAGKTAQHAPSGQASRPADTPTANSRTAGPARTDAAPAAANRAQQTTGQNVARPATSAQSASRAEAASPRPTDTADALPRPLRATLPQASRIQDQQGIQQLFRHSGLFAERSLVDARLQASMKSGSKAAAVTPQGSLAMPVIPLANNLAAPFLDLKFLLRRAARDLTSQPRSQTSTARPATTPAATTTASAGHTNAPQAQPHTGQAGRPSTSQTAQTPQGTNPGHAGRAENGVVSTTKLLDTLNARIDSSQIRTALHQIQGQGMWLMDVPLLLNDQMHRLQMSIHEEEGGSEQGDGGRWQLDIAIDLPGIGPMHASLHMTGETIDVHLYADEAQGREGLNHDIGQLQSGLQRAGLTPGQLAIHPGPPPKATRDRLNPPVPSGTQSWRA